MARLLTVGGLPLVDLELAVGCPVFIWRVVASILDQVYQWPRCLVGLQPPASWKMLAVEPVVAGLAHSGSLIRRVFDLVPELVQGLSNLIGVIEVRHAERRFDPSGMPIIPGVDDFVETLERDVRVPVVDSQNRLLQRQV